MSDYTLSTTSTTKSGRFASLDDAMTAASIIAFNLGETVYLSGFGDEAIVSPL